MHDCRSALQWLCLVGVSAEVLTRGVACVQALLSAEERRCDRILRLTDKVFADQAPVNPLEHKVCLLSLQSQRATNYVHPSVR